MGKKKPNYHKPISSVPYLPTVIIFDILSRVGIRTLFNCRLVCKTWADLISTPAFAQVHLPRSPSSCLMKHLNEERQPERFHLFDLEYSFNLSNKLVFLPDINLPNVPLHFVNSINGLLLLCRFNTILPDVDFVTNVYVCNPVLGEYITIPQPPHGLRSLSTAWAFGFCHKTNQYKVVTSSYSRSDEKDFTVIYTLGEGSWRSIENTPYPIRNNISYNAFLNGAIHWTGFYPDPFICCFDFETEQFREVDEPSDFGPSKRQYSAAMTVGVINGNLSICDFSYRIDEPVVIWVMKDYGVKESWTKDFVVSNIISDPNDSNFHDIEPTLFTGNGKILVIFNYGFIKIYDSQSKTSEFEMQVFGEYSRFNAIAHTPSLISLKDVAKGENLKVLGSN